LLCVGLLFGIAPAGASALSGPQLLTFGDYGTGTEISTQYEGQGILFKDEDGFYPEVRWDESAFTNPVLSGTFGFGSPISAEFVVPGTTTPATVENLAMDVGYINEPGSTELVIDHKSGGPFVLFANEYGFNHLFLGGGDISGFQLEEIGEEPAGFTLDNLEYTIPAPPPPPPPPEPATPANGCIEHQGNLWHKVVSGLKCKLTPAIAGGKCAVAIAINFPELRLAKAASGLYDLNKVTKSFKPVAKLYNDLKKATILPDAPKGYRSFGEIKGKLERAKSVLDVVKMVPSLARALKKKDFEAVFNDLIDLAGVRPCVDLLTK
jgi:hypothetical protein